MRNCQQTKCGLLGTPYCPQCSECGAEPNVINDDCVKCWNCEHDEGELRGNIQQGQQKEKELIIIKV